MKEEKRNVGRPKLVNEKTKGKSLKLIMLAVMLILVMIVGGVLSLRINFRNLNGNVSNFKYYSQKDSRWADKNFCYRTRNKSTVSRSGCGITSMAMILATFNNPNITPLGTMKEAKNGNFCGNDKNGTDYGYFKYSAQRHQLSYSEVSVSYSGVKRIQKALRNKSLVLANVQPNSPFPNSSGHYVVIYKIDDNDRVYVADPNVKTNSSYNLYDFVDKNWIRGGWAIINKNLVLKCPSSAKVGEQFTCRTNIAGATIYVSRRGLATNQGYNYSFTTTINDKTKQSKYLKAGDIKVTVKLNGAKSVTKTVHIR